ncbi:cytochrome c5 family protein [Jannaschia sp. M317]|uniref:c-type cytochrome n=1 Tax=Jannaschia sp. M317 TaxID=2867011 RepID=UPI0021A82F85|nr:c-type cytochrome [Jannaschia sp. M317]UWQ16813.1 c-type cytochrome [Jannaschia sp. M317]
MRRAGLVLGALAALSGPALGQAGPRGLDGFVTVDRLPVPEAPALRVGRDVWGGTCEICHGGNRLTGAPKITSTEDWSPRIETGLATLFTHAIEGFIGPRYAEMPSRGGNPDLSDAEVRAAVAFMVWASGGRRPALDWANGTAKDRIEQ